MPDLCLFSNRRRVISVWPSLPASQEGRSFIFLEKSDKSFMKNHIDDLMSVFPFSFLIDAQGCVVRMGDQAKAHFGDSLQIGARLGDFFKNSETGSSLNPQVVGAEKSQTVYFILTDHQFEAKIMPLNENLDSRFIVSGNQNELENQNHPQVKSGENEGPLQLSPRSSLVFLRSFVVEELTLPLECPYPMCRVNEKGAYYFQNKAAQAVFEILNRRPEIQMKLSEKVKDCFNRKQRGLFFVEFESCHFQILIVPFTRFNYVNLYFADISELRRVEKELAELKDLRFQQSQLAAIGEIASGIAHEINNPMAIINSVATVLTKKSEKEEFDKQFFIKSLNQLQNSVMRASQIVKSLEDFSRASDAETPSRFSLKGLLENVLSFCQGKAEVFRIHISLEVKDDWYVEGRVNELRHLFLALVRNSIEAVVAIPEKWVRIQVQKEGTFYFVHVHDSGPGISKHLEDKIFEPFYSTKPPTEGPGLGLSIARRVIQGHDGEIYVNHQFKNTCLTVRLPEKKMVGFIKSELESEIQPKREIENLSNFELTQKYQNSSFENSPQDERSLSLKETPHQSELSKKIS